MKAEVEFERTIRGVEVTIFANNFDGDPSVGIGYGPDELWAETADGQEFELTEDEYAKLSQEAAEVMIGREDDAQEAELREWVKEQHHRSEP